MRGNALLGKRDGRRLLRKAPWRGDGQDRDQLDAFIDPHDLAQRHGPLDEDLVVGEMHQAHPPHQVTPSGGAILLWTQDGDLQRAAAFEDLFKATTPFQRS